MQKGEHVVVGLLEPTTFDDRIKSIADKPNVIIRLGEAIDKRESERIEAERARYLQSERNFYELRSFGVSIPSVETVFQEEQNRIRACIKTERIIGQNLGKTDFSDLDSNEELILELGKCFGGLVAYLETKKREGGFFIGDLKNVQFVFGHKIDEEKNRAYLVDVDPFFNHRDPGSPVGLKFFSALSGVLAMMDAWIVKWQRAYPEKSVPGEWKDAIGKHLDLIAESVQEASKDQFAQRFMSSFKGRIDAFVRLVEGKREAVKADGHFGGWGGQEV